MRRQLGQDDTFQCVLCTNQPYRCVAERLASCRPLTNPYIKLVFVCYDHGLKGLKYLKTLGRTTVCRAWVRRLSQTFSG